MITIQKVDLFSLVSEYPTTIRHLEYLLFLPKSERGGCEGSFWESFNLCFTGSRFVINFLNFLIVSIRSLRNKNLQRWVQWCCKGSKETKWKRRFFFKNKKKSSAQHDSFFLTEKLLEMNILFTSSITPDEYVRALLRGQRTYECKEWNYLARQTFSPRPCSAIRQAFINFYRHFSSLVHSTIGCGEPVTNLMLLWKRKIWTLTSSSGKQVANKGHVCMARNITRVWTVSNVLVGAFQVEVMLKKCRGKHRTRTTSKHSSYKVIARAGSSPWADGEGASDHTSCWPSFWGGSVCVIDRNEKNGQADDGQQPRPSHGLITKVERLADRHIDAMNRRPLAALEVLPFGIACDASFITRGFSAPQISALEKGRCFICCFSFLRISQWWNGLHVVLCVFNLISIHFVPTGSLPLRAGFESEQRIFGGQWVWTLMRSSAPRVVLLRIWPQWSKGWELESDYEYECEHLFTHLMP